MIAHDQLCGFNGWCVLKRGHEGGCASRRNPRVVEPRPVEPVAPAAPEPPPPPPPPTLDSIRAVIGGLSDRSSNRAHNAAVREALGMIEQFLRARTKK